MKMGREIRISFFLAILGLVSVTTSDVNPELGEVWGPGLSPEKIVMPARYFFIKLLDSNNNDSKSLEVTIKGGTKKQKPCRVWSNTLDRKDGSYIVRYKLYETCSDLQISITLDGVHLGKSPYIINKEVLFDGCNCPMENIKDVLQTWDCGPVPKLLSSRIDQFGEIDWTKRRKNVIKKFDQPHSVSLCHYVVKNNKIHRKCYGKYVGFNMFFDNILLSLTRKVVLPDIEFFANLGDWPLSTHKLKEKYPILSWCGSTESYDIILPTYDITESSLENMGRVTLDILSVQANTEASWDDRIPKLFWRGRDSNKHRLDLIKMSRNHPDLFNVSLTNFFFYKDEEAVYGPKSEHVSFFEFFNYKYQLAIDGTVAPYRTPYLLAGGSLVFKPESKYFEFYYKDLEPNVHYVPVNQDISNLVEKIKWALDNDADAKRIADNGQKFANDNLLPKHIFCYHLHVFNEFSKVITSRVEVLDGMETVEQKVVDCNCKTERDEL